LGYIIKSKRGTQTPKSQIGGSAYTGKKEQNAKGGEELGQTKGRTSKDSLEKLPLLPDRERKSGGRRWRFSAGVKGIKGTTELKLITSEPEKFAKKNGARV